MSGPLNHRPSKVIQQLLISLSLGTEVSADDEWPIYLDTLPDGSDVEDNAMAVINTASIQQGRIQHSGLQVEYYGIQLYVRSNLEQEGWNKTKTINDIMDTSVYRNEITIGTDVYLVHDLNRTTDVIRLGPEQETSRRRFTTNFLVTLTQSS